VHWTHPCRHSLVTDVMAETPKKVEGLFIRRPLGRTEATEKVSSSRKCSLSKREIFSCTFFFLVVLLSALIVIQIPNQIHIPIPN
jgi:hypothetical protein